MNDGGIPPLEDTTTVNIALVDVTLNCNFPNETYLGIASNVTVLEDTIVCSGSTGLEYRVIDTSGICILEIMVYRGVRVKVFNTTFNNILVISWHSVLLVEETGVPGENHPPIASH